MTDLKYNDDLHEYKYRGAPIPSVTQVLPHVDFHMSETEMEKKKMAGKERHSKIKMFFDTGDTFGDTLLIDLNTWLNENKSITGKLVLYEENLFSKKHLFGGTPDMVFEKAVIDFKSSFYAPLVFSLQNAGYNILASENKIIPKTRKWLVLWPGTGGMKVKNVYNAQAEDVFIACVRKWHIDQTIKTYMKG